MQGAERYDIPMPPKPPGGLKRCSKCREYFEAVSANFGTVIHYRKGKSPVRYWRSMCRPCQNKSRGKIRSSTWPREDNRARDRALSRLVKTTPELFRLIFEEELRREYRKIGVAPDKIEPRIKKRLKYLDNYITAQKRVR